MMVASNMRASCTGTRECRRTRLVTEVYRDWVRGYPGNGFGVKPLTFSPSGEEIYFGSEVGGYVQLYSALGKGDVARGTNQTTVLTPEPCVNQDWIRAGELLYLSH